MKIELPFKYTFQAVGGNRGVDRDLFVRTSTLTIDEIDESTRGKRKVKGWVKY